MRNLAECSIKNSVPLVNHACRVNVQRCAVFFHELGKRHILAMQNNLSAAAQQSLLHLAIDESRYAESQQIDRGASDDLIGFEER